MTIISRKQTVYVSSKKCNAVLSDVPIDIQTTAQASQAAIALHPLLLQAWSCVALAMLMQLRQILAPPRVP